MTEFDKSHLKIENLKLPESKALKYSDIVPESEYPPFTREQIEGAIMNFIGQEVMLIGATLQLLEESLATDGSLVYAKFRLHGLSNLGEQSKETPIAYIEYTFLAPGNHGPKIGFTTVPTIYRSLIAAMDNTTVTTHEIMAYTKRNWVSLAPDATLDQ